MKKSKGFFIMAGIFAVASFIIPIVGAGVPVCLIIASINYMKEKNEVKKNDAPT